jgi:nucleoside-diphosphate-sugar epimerase
MSRVVVTGASGFIGRRVVARLEKSGHEVLPTVRSRPSEAETALDLFDAPQVDAFFEENRPETLLHLAWLTTPGEYLHSGENVRWLQASLSLLETFARSGGKRIVWAGTCLEYDTSAATPFIEEVTPARPGSLYAVCKHTLGEVTSAVAPQWGLEHCWARIFNVYGPGEHPSRLIAGTVRTLALGEQMKLSEGTQQRDFLHVNDVASALEIMIGSSQTGPVNVCSNIPVSVRDISSRIARMMDREELLKFGARPTPASEPPAIVGSNERLSSLGWTRSVELEEGLAEAIGRSTAVP